jgi:hypothetical protein
VTGQLWLELALAIGAAAAIFGLGRFSVDRQERAAAYRQRADDEATARARGFILYPDEMQEIASLPETRAPMPTYRGWVAGTQWEEWLGAQDRQYEAPRPPDLMDAAAAGYALGQQQASAAETHAEVNAMWAEIEANPARFGLRRRT